MCVCVCESLCVCVRARVRVSKCKKKSHTYKMCWWLIEWKDALQDPDAAHFMIIEKFASLIKTAVDSAMMSDVTMDLYESIYLL